MVVGFEAEPICIETTSQESAQAPSQNTCRLQGFCDASTKAYAAVLYLNVKVGDRIHTRFLTSNTRVAPTKTQTVLKLELLARLVPSMTSALSYEISLGRPTCFMDSKVVLHWIKRFTGTRE